MPGHAKLEMLGQDPLVQAGDKASAGLCCFLPVHTHADTYSSRRSSTTWGIGTGHEMQDQELCAHEQATQQLDYCQVELYARRQGGEVVKGRCEPARCSLVSLSINCFPPRRASQTKLLRLG